MDVTQDLSEQKSATFILDCDLILLEANFEACKLFRISKKKTLGHVFHEIDFPIEKKLAEQLVQVVMHFANGKEYDTVINAENKLSYLVEITPVSEGIKVELKNNKETATKPVAPSIRKTSGKKFGKYEVLSQIGKGGMGQVFSAKDSFENKVAIKVLLAGEFADEKDLLRFKREGTIMSRLNHRNICRIIEMGEDEGERYIAMEHIEGAELNSFIKENGLDVEKMTNHSSITSSLPEIGLDHPEVFRLKKILKVFLDILEGIHYAHQFDIIHRDLKPANIMIRKTGEPVVMDFGLAKYQDIGEHAQVSMSGEVMGTIEYIAPEQASASNEIDGRVDVYSAAAVLYQMLTGKKKLISSGNLYEDLSTLKDSTPLPPSYHQPSISDDLDTVVLKGLSVSPERRYESVRLFAADIQAIISDMPIMARKENFSDKVFRFIRKNKKASLASLVIMSLFGCLVTYHYFSMHQSILKFEQADRQRNEEQLKAHLATRELHDHIDNDLIEERWMEAKMKALKVLSLHPADPKAQGIIDHADLKMMEMEHPVPSHPVSGFPARIEHLKSVIQHWEKLKNLGPAQEVLEKLNDKLEKELYFQKKLNEKYSKLNLKHDEIGPYFINSIGMKLRYIPPGDFIMGDIALDTDHHAKISKGYFISETEVTQKQWHMLMDENQSSFKGEQLPVENLSWYTTLKFTEILSIHEGFLKEKRQNMGRQHYPTLIEESGYRLPTEAEWEYACRADLILHLYHWKEPTAKAIKAEPLWYSENTGLDHTDRKTQVVASFKANPWGIFDMHGNVSEWVLDTYHHKSYQNAASIDPVNTDLEGAGVIRGGSFKESLFSCRAGLRVPFNIDQLSESVGFRVAFIP